MKPLSVIFTIILVSSAFSNASKAQGIYHTGNSSYMTGYGQVNGSFGYAMATQQIYVTMQRSMQQAMTRAAMVKKWGEAAVRKAEAQSATKSASSRTTAATGPVVPPPPPAPKYYGRFRPDRTVNMAKTISDALAEDSADRATVKQIVEAVQGSYKTEAAANGWQNNLAGGMAFFLISMSTVYNDSAEPDEATTKAIYAAVNESIDAVPEFIKASDKDKHMLNDLLVGYTALPLAVYMEAKQNGDAATLRLAKVWAGDMIKLVLKTDPEKIKLVNGSMTIRK